MRRWRRLVCLIALVRATGGDVEFSRWLAACTNDAGTIWLRKGKHERALQMFRRALPHIAKTCETEKGRGVVVRR